MAKEPAKLLFHKPYILQQEVYLAFLLFLWIYCDIEEK